MGRVVGGVFMVCDVNVGGDCTGQGLDSGYKVCWAVVKGRTARRAPTAGWGRECVLARARAGYGGIDHINHRVEQDR